MALFETGEVNRSEAIKARERASPTFSEEVAKALERHIKGKWSEGEHKTENDFILRESFEMSLFGEFEVDNTTIWIVTSSKREHTNILFPNEF